MNPFDFQRGEDKTDAINRCMSDVDVLGQIMEDKAFADAVSVTWSQTRPQYAERVGSLVELIAAANEDSDASMSALGRALYRTVKHEVSKRIGPVVLAA